MDSKHETPGPLSEVSYDLIPAQWCWDVCPRCLSGSLKQSSIMSVEHAQPTNVGTPTKDQNRSKETLNNIGKIDFNLFI